MQSFNPREPVKAIIAALHEARVPIAAIDNVFELVKADIKNHTVPYNPKEATHGTYRCNSRQGLRADCHR